VLRGEKTLPTTTKTPIMTAFNMKSGQTSRKEGRVYEKGIFTVGGNPDFCSRCASSGD
jgi:hypothetical protein